ncbi:proline dehydrogenase [Cryomyces antarcticus]|uniref:Proline dehydrogenase n=1 Tax=Cryomyces antarcticus TaxID=329879 RepID=A0ABR0LWK3_9PEZI|nr:proline dehydrogenase [Cryomyces antarcticus]
MIRWLLKHTFYAQFCAGESRAEVQRTMKALKDVGYRGIILEYALEVLKSEGGNVEKDIETWRQGMIETVQMTAEGDFVGLKWSGLGSAALDLLQHNQPPSPSMDKAIREVCDLASSKGVKLLPAAEETRTNTGIDQWSLNLQKQYNNTPGKVVLYNTYQCYLKATPATLARHLAAARRDGFTLGIKLVRGAYLAAEPEHLTLATKEETDSAYDSIAESLMKRQYGSVLAPLQGFGSEAFPAIDVVLACHNAVSVRKAQALRSEQSARGEPKVPLVYAQLQGMADEVSCELVQAGKAQLDADSEKLDIDVPEVYKCATWGTTGQCLNYLLRRAAENKDAAGRTKESRRAMAGELWRRIRAVAGLA